MKLLSKADDLICHLIKCLDCKIFLVPSLDYAPELSQFANAVYVTPMSADRFGETRKNDCAAFFRCEFLISTFYRCYEPTIGDTGTNVEIDKDTGEKCFSGPFFEGDELNCKVMDCIKDFNCEQRECNPYKSDYSQYILSSVLDPIYEDGCVIFRTKYTKDFIYKY